MYSMCAVCMVYVWEYMYSMCAVCMVYVWEYVCCVYGICVGVYVFDVYV